MDHATALQSALQRLRPGLRRRLSRPPDHQPSRSTSITTPSATHSPVSIKPYRSKNKLHHRPSPSTDKTSQCPHSPTREILPLLPHGSHSTLLKAPLSQPLRRSLFAMDR